VSLPGDSAVQQAQPVIAKVPAVADTQEFLDEQVDGFGASVADATGDEVGEKFGAPGVDRAGQSAQFG
jgi:hypothetical protein